MNFLTLKLRSQLKQLLPAGEILFEESILEKYSGDKWFAVHKPDAVALPRSTKSVSKLLRFANRHGIPVTPRGAGHGYVGGCVPMKGGIVLSLERMNRIREINAEDFAVVTEPGITTQALQEAVERKGLYYPPDPASRKDSSIGGNIAT
ncbi:MAG TPA: FAD-binding oxidoreductase, partial [Candidatus Paceibacterota bacterium]|nr:FAD-binding oxidoreductase [Candidatus Paceibacterota bacterium]